MPNRRGAMPESRLRAQKRRVEGLPAEEAPRYAQPRDLVGAETAGPPRSGFDVNAGPASVARAPQRCAPSPGKGSA